MSDVPGLGGGGANGRHGGAEQGGDTLFCYFHPREFLVGVCAHCLRDRLLLLLASSKHGAGGGHRARSPADGASYLSARPYCSRAVRRRTGSSISLPKVFALGSSFLHRQLDYNSSSRHHTAVDDDDGGDDNKKNGAGAEEDASVASLDDSFISIKFEDNGKATWDSQKAAAGAGDDAKPKAATKTTTRAVVEHVKRGGGGVTRWRKLLQLARWKRSTPGSRHQQQQEQRSKGRSWIRSLTQRRADRAWS